MSLRIRIAAGAALLFLLAACASGPARRVSEPAAGIQQLTVGADGSWTVEIRIDNFSSIPMRFDALELKLGVGGRLGLELRFTWLGGARVLDRVDRVRARLLECRPTLGVRDVPTLLWRAVTWRVVRGRGPE